MGINRWLKVMFAGYAHACMCTMFVRANAYFTFKRMQCLYANDFSSSMCDYVCSFDVKCCTKSDHFIVILSYIVLYCPI